MRNRVEPTEAWDRSHRSKSRHFAIAEGLRASLADMALDATLDTKWDAADNDMRGFSLQVIRGYSALATMIDDLTCEAIQSARAEGISWAELGAAMNMSKQAAQQRYGRLLDSTTCGLSAD